MKLFKKALCLFAVMAIISSAFLCSAAPVLFGDANGDNAVDSRDLVHTKKAIANLTSANNADAVDLNCDTQVNGSDLVVLRNYFLTDVIPELGVDITDFE